MGSIYRQARAGEMPWVDAWLAVKILEKIRLAVENSEYEQTLQALEAERGIGTARPNGSGYAAASRRAGPS